MIENNNENIIYGRNAVMEALLSDKPVDTVYVVKGTTGLHKHIELAKNRGAVVKDADAVKLNKLISDSLSSETGSQSGKAAVNINGHGGIAAVLSAVDYASLEDILNASKMKNKPPFIIIADEIEDPHNLGALIRTAEAAGADGLIIPKRRSASLNATVHKTSAGAASWLPVCRVSNLVDTIKEIKKHNIWVYGAEADGNPFYSVKLDGGVCLVIGSEAKGLGRLVRESCDMIISIDMYGNINSLNASVSGAILMYEIVKYRRNIR